MKILANIVLLACLFLAGCSRPESAEERYERVTRELDANVKSFSSAQHLSEAKRLFAVKETNYSKQHLEAIPEAAPEYQEAQKLLTEVLAEETTQSSKVAESQTKWHYEDQTDPMTSERIRIAAIESENTVDFDFPYDGGSRGSLIIRKKGDEDNAEMIFQVSRGQIVSSQSVVRLRFDDSPPISVYYNEPESRDPKLIFLSDEKQLIERLKSANTLKMEVGFYRDGKRVFEFDVTKLNWQ